MKTIDNYINEKLKIGKSIKIQYTCQPKDKYELRKILEERLAKDKNANLNDIDVSKITDMGVMSILGIDLGLFERLDPHNIDISQWDVSNVKNMDYMFYRCSNFECTGLENWNVSKVNDMRFMFYGCEKIEGKELEDWDISNVERLNYMLSGCKKINCDLSNWNVSKVTHMNSMFEKCENFEGKGLENWNVSNVKDLRFMFFCCIKFNCDLSAWDISKVEYMGSMFDICKSLKNKPSWYKE